MTSRLLWRVTYSETHSVCLSDGLLRIPRVLTPGLDVYAPAPLARSGQHARPRSAHRPDRVSTPGMDTDTENRESPCLCQSRPLRIDSINNFVMQAGGRRREAVLHDRHFPTSGALSRSSWIYLVGSEGVG